VSWKHSYTTACLIVAYSEFPLDNIEYDKLKNLIKVHTTDVQGQTIAIPEQGGVASKNFEELFFNELSDQHNCADLFVKSKADEIRRRLREQLFS
jgi:hypothetical protein